MERMPEDNIPYNAGITPIIQGYFGVGDTATANYMVEKYEEQLTSELDYLLLLSNTNKYRYSKSSNDFLSAVRDINQLRQMCVGYGEIEAARRLEEKLNTYGSEYERLFR
jgi:hypothetical protein